MGWFIALWALWTLFSPALAEIAKKLKNQPEYPRQIAVNIAKPNMCVP